MKPVLIVLLTTLVISGGATAEETDEQIKAALERGLTSDMPNYLVGVPGGNGDAPARTTSFPTKNPSQGWVF